MKKYVYIAAGGTGGHINAAISLGDIFGEDYQVKFLSGTRYLDYQLFKNKNCLHLQSKPLRTKNPLKLFMNLSFNLFVFFKILFLYLLKRPCFVIGAGGYICGPTLLAAKILFIPIFIVEQNAIAGVTNKILAKFSNLIFTNFEHTKGIPKGPKVLKSGNPIRNTIKESKNLIVDNEIKVLVFGGSLGAQQINEAIIELLDRWSGRPITIKHQVGKNNIKKLTFENENIEYEQFEYIDDMNEKYDWSNIIISRAGASTISELRVVKRPTIIIPFPGATDNHQYFNALELQKEDASKVVILDHLKTSSELSGDIKKNLNDIICNDVFYQNKNDIENASGKIKKEIEKYVRN